MHADERERAILDAMSKDGFVTYRKLASLIEASPATIRRDLQKLESDGQIIRVHGGAKLPDPIGDNDSPLALAGTPFDQSMSCNRAAKEAIGEKAASLCHAGEAVIIDGGTTTYQMCPHLAGLGLQVLTNSLHILNALVGQAGTRLLVPSGSIFKEQNIILAPGGEAAMPQFHARRLFLGAASVGEYGVSQSDAILVASQRRFIEHADECVLVVDSSKFEGGAGGIVCGLSAITTVVTDNGIAPDKASMLKDHNVEVIIAK